MKKFVLASKSPRRKELLRSLKVEFDIVVSNADEESVSKDIEPHLYVQELSLIKATSAAKDMKSGCIVIGSDTIVEYDGEFLGKPKDKEDARRMLGSLSGNVHRVYSGICLFDTSTGKAVTDYECTKVYFKPITEEQMQAYISSSEPYDKAGGYAIQGDASVFVDRIEGDYNNVVGLPLDKLKQLIKDEFDIILEE